MNYSDPAMVKSNFERFEHDEYFTIDQTAIDGLWYYLKNHLKCERSEFDVWEPACGMGHISKYLEARGVSVKSTDLIDRGYGIGNRDFLKEQFTYKAKHIITNPPYADDLIDQFAERAISYVTKTGGIAAFLCRNEMDCAKKRRKFTDEKSIFWKKIVLQKRPIWVEKKKDEKSSSPRHNYSWFVWNGELAHEPIGGATVHYYHPDMEKA